MIGKLIILKWSKIWRQWFNWLMYFNELNKLYHHYIVKYPCTSPQLQQPRSTAWTWTLLLQLMQPETENTLKQSFGWISLLHRNEPTGHNEREPQSHGNAVVVLFILHTYNKNRRKKIFIEIASVSLRWAGHWQSVRGVRCDNKRYGWRTATLAPCF